LLDGGGPEHHDIDAAIGLAIGAQGLGDPPGGVLGVPRFHPGPHPVFQIGNDLRGDALIDILTVAIRGGLLGLGVGFPGHRAFSPLSPGCACNPEARPRGRRSGGKRSRLAAGGGGSPGLHGTPLKEGVEEGRGHPRRTPAQGTKGGCLDGVGARPPRRRENNAR